MRGACRKGPGKSETPRGRSETRPGVQSSHETGVTKGGSSSRRFPRREDAPRFPHRDIWEAPHQRRPAQGSRARDAIERARTSRCLGGGCAYASSSRRQNLTGRAGGMPDCVSRPAAPSPPNAADSRLSKPQSRADQPPCRGGLVRRNRATQDSSKVLLHQARQLRRAIPLAEMPQLAHGQRAWIRLHQRHDVTGLSELTLGAVLGGGSCCN